MTTDALSGLDFYQIKYIDITPERKEEAMGFFTEATSPYKLPFLEIGKYLIVVRAYDVAGNFREGTAEIQILPKNLLISKKGIQYRKIIIPWWLLILFLIIILGLIGFNFWRKYKELEKRRGKKKFFEIKSKKPEKPAEKIIV
jgi:hypothetical protein